MKTKQFLLKQFLPLMGFSKYEADQDGNVRNIRTKKAANVETGSANLRLLHNDGFRLRLTPKYILSLRIAGNPGKKVTESKITPKVKKAAPSKSRKDWGKAFEKKGNVSFVWTGPPEKEAPKSAPEAPKDSKLVELSKAVDEAKSKLSRSIELVGIQKTLLTYEEGKLKDNQKALRAAREALAEEINK